MKYEKMNPRVKKKWLKALRSGEYLQGTLQLCTPTYLTNPSTSPDLPAQIDEDGDYKFCCLGVLENLYCLEKNLDFPLDRMEEGFHSPEAAEWSGLLRNTLDVMSDTQVHLIDNPALEQLTAMNDGQDFSEIWGHPKINKRTFKGIATWIEKNL